MVEIVIRTDVSGAAIIYTQLEELIQTHYSRIKTERPEYLDKIKDVLKQIEDQLGGHPANAKFV